MQGYLGDEWVVVASYGHVRDLPRKPGSVDPQQQFSMTWDSSPRQREHMAPIKQHARGAQQVVLATDPDREGEAISWHIYEMLKVEPCKCRAPVLYCLEKFMQSIVCFACSFARWLM